LNSTTINNNQGGETLPPLKENDMNAIQIIQDYINKLESHDWSYTYSDDHSTWERGSKSRDELLDLQKQIDVDFQIWNTIAPDDWKNGKY
jgi:hypothetical protein